MKTKLFLAVALMTLLVAGPVAAQPNATWYAAPGWSFPVVPMHWEAPPVWLPDVLYGNEPSTHWNASGTNSGTSPIPAGMFTFMFIDGMYADSVGWGEIPAGGSFGAMNRGLIEVRGGRHVMSVVHDGFGFVAESNENDNAWGRQFVWSPYLLNNSTPMTFSQPPLATAGWDHLGVPATGSNCDGYGFSFALSWTAVAVHAQDNAADYDLEMFDVPLIQDEAFFGNVAQSNVGAGHLDFVLANGHQVATTDYHVGVKAYQGTGNYVIQKVNSWFTNVGDVLPTAMAQDEFLKIWELTVESGQTGTMLLAVDSAPGTQLRLAVFDQSFQVGGLLDAAVIEGSAEDGTLRLPYDFAVPGDYALAVYRDPVDGTGPVDFTLSTNELAVDLAPGFLATWHSPLVPRQSADGTPASVALPLWLNGWAPAETYFNIAVVNHGPDTVDGISTLSYMDGLRSSPEHSFFRGILGSAPAGGFLMVNNIPRYMQGGRHVWTLEVDPGDTVAESSESNNIWGEQYVWTGLSLEYGPNYWAGNADALETGGWETITSGEPIGLNCNGYRLLDAPLGWWRAVALSHDPAEDLDLALHLPATSPKDGYDTHLAQSFFSGGYTDFVLVNENLGFVDDTDLGVVRYSGSTGSYELDAVQSAIVNDPLTSPIGPVQLGEHRMLDVYDIYFEPGTYSIQLENIAGNVDWGIQLQQADLQYLSRDDHFSQAVAFDNGPGQGEVFQVEITNPAWYALVVYKSRVQDRMVEGTYRVNTSNGSSPVPDEVPNLQTQIAAIKPNPFNPSTEINFELAQAGTAQLEIYNVQGALMCTLVSAHLEAGNHAVRWDGLDRTGRRVSSGVYMARLRSGGQDTMAKMMMLK